ncbi:hypothetical protein RFF05_03175 [Bengtsoniella intestinalis]|uniref:hypothetical protein n=1 Tax=Bengtsoniella intestinalis TaxID=3073143 RepID=UPI00391F20E8
MLLNISYMGVLTVCAYFAIQNLLFGDGKAKGIHIFCLVFIATEYALWIASCFWISDIWTNPYFWFDFLLTAEIGLFFPVVNRAVRP